jgi:prepilin-type N-terminal cleavage/methylation domain-containing protein
MRASTGEVMQIHRVSRNHEHGFTLLELMIAIALMLIVMLMLRTMFTSAQAMYLVTARRIECFQSGRVAMDYIEQDLLRAVTTTGEDNIQLRSLSADDLKDQNLPYNKFYSQLTNYNEAEDGETTKIKEFLSFQGTSTWWDSTKKAYTTGDAIVVYYLRTRPEPANGERQDGAYLVRRVIPVRTLAEITKSSKLGWDPKKTRTIAPHDDEIASFIYSVRVFVDDKAAFQWGVQRSNTIYNVLPECREDTANHLWKARETPPPPPIPGGNQKNGMTILLTKPQDAKCVQMGSTFASMVRNPKREFISTLAEYPSVVVIELTFIDKTFTRTDGAGSYRTFTRAIHCPYAPALRWLDQRDTELAAAKIK